MTIFYRQQVEEKRRRPLGVGLNTVILFLIAVALHILFPNLNSDIKMVIYLLIFTYDMLFFLATSTFQDELEMDQFLSARQIGAESLGYAERSFGPLQRSN